MSNHKEAKDHQKHWTCFIRGHFLQAGSGRQTSAKPTQAGPLRKTKVPWEVWGSPLFPLLAGTLEQIWGEQTNFSSMKSLGTPCSFLEKLGLHHILIGENSGISVPDPRRFDMDPDPRIRTTGLRICILLSSSVAFKMPTKFLLVNYRYIYWIKSVSEDNKLLQEICWFLMQFFEDKLTTFSHSSLG